MRRAVLLMLALGLGVAVPARATAPYRSAQEIHAQADAASVPAEARRLYREAAAAYQDVIAAAPEHCAARLYRAVCLSQLAPLTENGAERLGLLQEADRGYAAAADCPGVDPAVFEQWAILLRTDLYNALSDPAAKRAALDRVVGVCERGLPLANAPTPRAQLQRHLGSALAWAAAFVEDPAARRVLLERAVEQLRAAGGVVAARQSLYQDNDLGAALLSLGHLTGDKALLREAAAELETALRFYPEQYDTYYNLAAAWCLLGDIERAGEYLAVAIDHDASGEFARHAATDPNLAPLRASAAYTAALDRRRRQQAEAQAGELFDEALRAQQTAATVKAPEMATALLGRAVDLCRQIVALTPDHYQAQALQATALARLAEVSRGQPDQQRPYLEAARQQFSRAGQSARADAVLYEQWARFLSDTCLPLTTEPGARQALLGELRQVLEQGIGVARFSSLRGRLESQLGICLVLLAQGAPNRSDAAGLYAEAIKHFPAAAAAEHLSQSAQFNQLWGAALLGAGQSAGDPALVRQAVERLARSLEIEPANPRAAYSLACAYVALRQLAPALRHLERCLELDAGGEFRRLALADPDLEPLRRTARFRQLVGLPRPGPDRQRPTVSGR